MKPHLEKMATARAIIKQRSPYFSTTLFSLIPHEFPGLGTICTTKKLVMGYDPAWFASLSDEEAAGAVFHEIGHVVRKHFERGEFFSDKKKFNIAGDLPINDDAKEAGYVLPEGSVFAHTYKLKTGLSSEEYYELLPDNPGGDGNQQQQQQKQQPCAGNCGGASGNPHPQEDEINQQVEDESPGATKSEADVKDILRQQAKEIIDYAESHGRGSVPNHLVEWAKFAIKPAKVPWRRKLPRYLRRALGRTKAGGQNYSKKRLSKRSFLRGVIIPGLVDHEPEILFVRDSSASMGAKQLEDVQNEAIGAMKAAGVTHVWFMDCDAAAAKPRRVTLREIPRLKITGRGGTDFRPALEAARKLKPRPKVILYFTDGDGRAPASPPAGITVIWVVVRSHWNKSPANWGHTIFVDD